MENKFIGIKNMLIRWPIHAVVLAVCFYIIKGQHRANTPPEVRVSREWVVSEADEIDSIISHITATDEENDPLRLTLAPPRSPMPNGSGIMKGHTYFYIDDHGRVRLKKPVKGLAGKSFLVSILVNDGHYTSRIDVRVRVLKPMGNVKFSPSALADALVGPTYGSIPGAIVAIPSITNAQLSDDNQPPHLFMEPYTVWTVDSGAEAGSVINRVEADDYSNTFLKLTLKPDDLLTIDQNTGDVSVKRDLNDMVGTYVINVTASNGHASISELVTLKIISKDDLTVEKVTPTDPSVIIVVQSTTPNTPASRLPVTKPTSKPSTASTSKSATANTIIKVLQKGVPTDAVSATKEVESLSWIVQATIYLVLIAAAIIACIFLYRWMSKKKMPANHKSLSVRYTDQSTTSSTKKDKSLSDILTVVGIKKRAESNKYESSNRNIEKIPNRQEKKLSLNVTGDRWEFPRHKLLFLTKLGEGCFGQVWLCETNGLLSKDQTKSFVAVKLLKESAGSEEKRDLLQELKVLKSLDKHPNVVSLLGCCTVDGPTFVILEHMVGGKLQSYLRDSRSNCEYGNLYGPSASLTPKDLIIFALQVAKGMDFLSRNNLIHRDLAARNVLVGDDKICKVADFGFARDVANHHVYERKSNGKMPIRWMAPESLFDNIFTTKSDVWSFGILLWEIVTLGAIPYPGVSASDVQWKIRQGERLEKPDHCRREIYNIMFYCWYLDPDERPSFSELVKSLEGLILSEVDYIQLDNFPDHTYYNFTTTGASDELL